MTTTTDFRGLLTDAPTALRFLLAGDARLTIRDEAFGRRFTYRIAAPKADTERGGRVTDFTSNVRFVNLADNEDTRQFLGTIFVADRVFRTSRKSRVSPDAPSVRTFGEVWGALAGLGQMPVGFSLWHEGRCGRCGRTLTVPASIASGFGPDCAALLGLDQTEPQVDTSDVDAPAHLPVGDVDARAEWAIDAVLAERAIQGGSDVRPAPRPCWKCGGTGRFITRYGRDFGPCFACNGGGA